MADVYADYLATCTAFNRSGHELATVLFVPASSAGVRARDHDGSGTWHVAHGTHRCCLDGVLLTDVVLRAIDKVESVWRDGNVVFYDRGLGQA